MCTKIYTFTSVIGFCCIFGLYFYDTRIIAFVAKITKIRPRIRANLGRREKTDKNAQHFLYMCVCCKYFFLIIRAARTTPQKWHAWEIFVVVVIMREKKITEVVCKGNGRERKKTAVSYTINKILLLVSRASAYLVGRLFVS